MIGVLLILTLIDMKNQVNRLLKESKEAVKNVEVFAESQGVYLRLSSCEVENLFYRKAGRKWPMWAEYGKGENLINGHDLFVERTAIEVERVEQNAAIFFLQRIRPENYKKNKVKIKDLYAWKRGIELFGLKGEWVIVEEYVNGKTLIEMDQAFNEAFGKIYNWTNEATRIILDNLTQEHKERILKLKKEKYGNPYRVIWEIKEKLGIVEPINTFLIF